MPGDTKGMEGLLLVDKPTGPTSHDIVADIRSLLGGGKVGHAGTLDPLASGLLIIMVGRATKLAPFIPGDPKVYEGSVLLGLSTDSMDIQGEIISEVGYEGDPDGVRTVLDSLVGELRQIPPMYSAAKYRGKPLYRYARKGEEVPRRSRKVRLYGVEMVDFHRRGAGTEFDFVISCSPGFYVREFASRVGEILGCGAVLTRLRRTASGPFSLREALSMEALSLRCQRGNPPLLSLARALDGLKTVVVSREAERAARNGAVLDQSMLEDMEKEIEEGDTVVVMTVDREIIGLHHTVDSEPFTSRPRRII